MKIDFSSVITELDGSPAQSEGKPLTLATLAIGALVTPLLDAAGEVERLEGTAKVRLAKLAHDIFAAGETALEVTIEDAALIKERIGRAFAPVAVMRGWALLDPPSSAAD